MGCVIPAVSCTSLSFFRTSLGPRLLAVAALVLCCTTSSTTQHRRPVSGMSPVEVIIARCTGGVSQCGRGDTCMHRQALTFHGRFPEFRMFTQLWQRRAYCSKGRPWGPCSASRRGQIKRAHCALVRLPFLCASELAGAIRIGPCSTIVWNLSSHTTPSSRYDGQFCVFSLWQRTEVPPPFATNIPHRLVSWRFGAIILNSVSCRRVVDGVAGALRQRRVFEMGPTWAELRPGWRHRLQVTMLHKICCIFVGAAVGMWLVAEPIGCVAVAVEFARRVRVSPQVSVRARHAVSWPAFLCLFGCCLLSELLAVAPGTECVRGSLGAHDGLGLAAVASRGAGGGTLFVHRALPPVGGASGDAWRTTCTGNCQQPKISQPRRCEAANYDDIDSPAHIIR